LIYYSARNVNAEQKVAQKMNKQKFEPYSRITEPMVRENGKLRIATWQEALTKAATGLASARDAFSPSAVGFFSCSKSTNEMNFIAQKFARAVIGTNNIDSCNRT
jgi:formate dehydrogenase (hydrogenase)